jgi:alpha-glucosidase (family GH31 glycosyl hydrolase)
MVAPIVTERAIEREVYFPAVTEEWYQFKIDPKKGTVN